MPRKRKKRAAIPGLSCRGGRGYWQRLVPGVGRVYRAVDAECGSELHVQRVTALNTLLERGDKGVIRRWARGEPGAPDITDIVRAVREGDYKRLRRLNIEGPTLGAACDRFVERAENTLNPKSAAQYRSILSALRAHFTDDRPLASISTTEAEAFLWAPRIGQGDEMRPWARATQGDARTVCKALWQMVIDDEAEEAERQGALPHVTINPWRRAKVRPRTKTRHAYLLPEEWRALARHPKVAGTPTLTLLALGCLAGLRRGEICHLRTGIDVDLAAGVLRIQPRGGEYAWEPKGFSHGETNSVRDVPIVPALRRILEGHIARGYAGARYFLHGRWFDRPLGESTAEDWTRTALTAAGLTYGRDDEDTLTLHTFRHTFATWLVAAGVPIPTVARLMGNTPAVVLDTYAHHVPGDEGRALQVIQERAE